MMCGQDSFELHAMVFDCIYNLRQMTIMNPCDAQCVTSTMRYSYLLGLYWIDYGCLLGVFIDEEVHVVVGESRKQFDLHI